MTKGIYAGPPHYWHNRSLVPREKYYYGYYGYYGPWTDPKMYRPVGGVDTISLEQFCGGCGNSWLGMLIVAFVLYYFFVRK